MPSFIGSISISSELLQSVLDFLTEEEIDVDSITWEEAIAYLLEQAQLVRVMRPVY